MEKLLQACAVPVQQKNKNKEDMINLKWLLIDEGIELSIMKVAYSGITKENMPKHLKLVLIEPTRVSRQNSPTIVAHSYYKLKRRTKYLKTCETI